MGGTPAPPFTDKIRKVVFEVFPYCHFKLWMIFSKRDTCTVCIAHNLSSPPSKSKTKLSSHQILDQFWKRDSFTQSYHFFNPSPPTKSKTNFKSLHQIGSLEHLFGKFAIFSVSPVFRVWANICVKYTEIFVSNIRIVFCRKNFR